MLSWIQLYVYNIKIKVQIISAETYINNVPKNAFIETLIIIHATNWSSKLVIVQYNSKKKTANSIQGELKP